MVNYTAYGQCDRVGLCNRSGRNPRYEDPIMYWTTPSAKAFFALNVYGDVYPPYTRVFLKYAGKIMPEHDIVIANRPGTALASYIFEYLADGTEYQACVQPMMHLDDKSLTISCSAIWTVDSNCLLPTGVILETSSEGVRVSWNGTAERYMLRVYGTAKNGGSRFHYEATTTELFMFVSNDIFADLSEVEFSVQSMCGSAITEEVHELLT